MTHLVNSLDDLVTEAVDGLVRSSGGAVERLDGYPDIKVVVRADLDPDRVAIVSGGGAGHEPAHAGFVGQGLLSAAVCGEVFASPSVDAVLAAVVAVTGPAGCLLIVKNYTGDRLTFGLASERARAMGLQVEVVVVADDIALPGQSQPRGLAGTLLVHKVAGALAERGADLAEVAEAARRVAAAVRTIGVSLSPVRIPGRPTEDRIPEGSAELGLGIHGEPGARTVAVDGAAGLVRQMAHLLADGLPDGPLVLLLNNLGGVSALEMGIVTNDLLGGPLGIRTHLLVGPAPLMTSLSAQGFSVSAMPVDDVLLDALTAPVAAHTAWPASARRPAGRPAEIGVRPVSQTTHVTASPSRNDQARSILVAICTDLIKDEARLNSLDARTGDGDTGSTFATAARRLLSGVDELPLSNPVALFRAISDQLATSMGGSSGVLGSIFFAAAAGASGASTSLPSALDAGLEAVRRHGGAEVGDRTLLDALAPALNVLRAGGSADEAADAAETGAQSTAAMTSARAGRSAHVPSEHLLDVVDPGAAAIAGIFKAGASV